MLCHRFAQQSNSWVEFGHRFQIPEHIRIYYLPFFILATRNPLLSARTLFDSFTITSIILSGYVSLLNNKAFDRLHDLAVPIGDFCLFETDFGLLVNTDSEILHITP